MSQFTQRHLREMIEQIIVEEVKPIMQYRKDPWACAQFSDSESFAPATSTYGYPVHKKYKDILGQTGKPYTHIFTVLPVHQPNYVVLSKAGAMLKGPITPNEMKKILLSHPDAEISSAANIEFKNGSHKAFGGIMNATRGIAQRLSPDFEQQSQKWHELLRMTLGIAGIVDLGSETVYSADPVKVLVLDPGTIIHLKTIPRDGSPPSKLNL